MVHENAPFGVLHQRVAMDCCICLTRPKIAKLVVRRAEEYPPLDVTVGGELKDQTKHVISTPAHKVVLTTGFEQEHLKSCFSVIIFSYFVLSLLPRTLLD